MGGLGSGRYGGAPVVEDGLVLDIDKLRRDGIIRPGVSRNSVLRWEEVYSGRRVGSIGYVSRIGYEEGSIRLTYTTTGYAEGKIQSDYEIELETVPQPFGGRRWYFVCPRLGTRVSKLYMPPGSTRFLSRGAYRRLAYRSQREAPFDRAISRAYQLRRRLGDQGAIGDWIEKPKWIRWRTFNREVERIECAEAVVNARLAGFLARFGRRA